MFVAFAVLSLPTIGPTAKAMSKTVNAKSQKVKVESQTPANSKNDDKKLQQLIKRCLRNPYHHKLDCPSAS